MTQGPPPGNAPRRAPSTLSPSDLDALLESLQAEPRAANTGTQPPSSERSGDLTARRVQALIRAFDVLQKQVGAIASQGETISKVAENQSRDARAIGELQRNMRYLRAVVIQQLQGGTQPFPPLQIKLLVGHLVEQYQQAERDAAMLASWAMLFVGLALGLGGASAYVAVSQNGLVLSIFVAVAALALLVAIIFWSLSRSARLRAVAARRAMDESTMQRRIAAESPADQT